MNIIENLILNSIYLLFPLCIYLIYITYIRNMDKKEKGIILEFALLSSLFLMIRFSKNRSLYIIILYNIPLLLSYLKNKVPVAIFISIILVCYYKTYSNIPLIVSIIEYSIYLIVYFLTKEKENREEYLIHIFVIMKSFLSAVLIYLCFEPTGFSLNNTLYLLIVMTIFICYSYLITYLFKKGEDMVELNTTLQELKREKMLRASLSKLTHEIKNPIAVCKGYLEMIDKKGIENSHRYISIIEDEINRALTVITDFSTFGKLTQIEKEEVDLRLVLEEIIEVVTPLFKKSNSKIELKMKEEELYIDLDYSKIKQVLVNIIKNSLEAKKKEEHLVVTIDVKTYINTVRIIIKDTGIGMNKETLNRISEVFYTTKEKGSGLGVALSKEIIELHKGTMTYQSTPNKGTTVTITLPQK